jgi:uncharacterized protein (DUF2236 family)
MKSRPEGRRGLAGLRNSCDGLSHADQRDAPHCHPTSQPSTLHPKSPSMPSIRHQIATHIRQLVGSDGAPLPPRADDGFFAQGSPGWRVHGDFTSMMIGGTSALLLQMLHPHALAGVWDHSKWQADSLGRLKRTAQFIGLTTYGDTARARASIAHVRHIHDRVHGHLPDGTPYSANDPATLTWVHIAGASRFLAAYVRYRDPAFPRASQDQYYAQSAQVARELGAADVPESVHAVNRYLRTVRPVLRADRRTREVARALLNQPAPNLAAAGMGRVMIDAAIDLLPDWAARMHGLSVPLARVPLVRAGAHGIGTVLRWALADGRRAT